MTATLGCALLAAALAGAQGELHPIDEDLGGPESRWSAYLVEEIERAPPALEADEASRPLSLTCVATPGNDRYVGVVQDAVIRAPLAAVQAIMDDVAHYRDLFPGCERVDVVPGSADGNRFVTSWEMKGPIFLLPSTRFELTVLVSRPRPTTIVTRYRLRRGERLVHSDGMVVLEALGESATRFREHDFFEARWGPLPAELVWRESLRDVFLSDVAVKLKAENPDWTYRRVANEAKRLLSREGDRIDRCRAERHPAPLATARERETR